MSGRYLIQCDVDDDENYDTSPEFHMHGVFFVVGKGSELLTSKGGLPIWSTNRRVSGSPFEV